MKITFPCTNCSAELETEAAAVGTQVECPGCKSVLIVPRKEVGPGTTIGGFKIEKLLGRGGMGEVWLASQLSLERAVALKILPSQLGMNPAAAKRFLQEVRMLARLQHSNIVPAWEAGEDAGILFFAMAYVPGESLEARLQRTGAMTEPEALQLAGKVGGALAYAWNQHQLLHRDVKPSNILLGSNGEPQLVDLGLAKSLTDSVNLTVSGGVMGTPNYMSPEQARGVGDVDCRTDIYSLGMTLYHMVTGQVPFDSASPMETMRRQIMEALPDPREFNPSVSEPCVALLETMLAKSPAKRHETWEILLEDMGRVSAGQSPSRMLGGDGGSVLMVRGKGGPATPQKPAVPKSSPRVAALPPRKGKRVPVLAGISVGLVTLLGLGAWMFLGKGHAVKGPKHAATASVQTEAKPASTTTNIIPGITIKGQGAYLEALEYVRSHPTDFDGAVARFETAQKEAAGTTWAHKAEKEIERLRSEKKKAVDSLIASLKADAERAAASGKFEEALKPLEDEAGSLATETATVRAELVAKLKQQQAEAHAAKEAAAQAEAAAKEREAEARRRETTQARLGTVLTATANDVLRQDCAGALKRLSGAVADPELAEMTNELAQAQAAVTRLVAMPETVLAGFEREKGQETSVEFVNGQKVALTVLGVEAGMVKARQALGSVGYLDRKFSVTELATAEKYRRLGTETTPEVQWLRGVLACMANNWGVAEKELSQAGQGLPAVLADVIKKRFSPPPGKPADSMASKGSDAGSAEKPPSVTKPAEGVPESPMAAVSTGAAKKAGEDPSMPVALKEATEENVRQALTALQPQLDSPPKYTFGPDGIVLNLGNNPRLQDLRALAGLPIAELDLRRAAVKELAPLVGMPLKRLIVTDTKVNSLAPLSKTVTLEHLNAGNTLITDLSPLRGLSRLKVLFFYGEKIKDLAPLENLEDLTQLSFSGADFASLSPLQKLRKLKSLGMPSCWRVTSLSPLANTGLEVLILNDSRVESLAPLRGMPLKTLRVGGMPVKDWTPLAGMSLDTFMIDGRMQSLHLLKGLKAVRLEIWGVWHEGIEKLPEYVSGVERVIFRKAPLPPSGCPEFVFRFPSLQTIKWYTGYTTEQTEELLVEEFKAKYIKKTAK